MKYVICLFALLILPFTGSAQSNLQFSQAKLVSSTLETVPTDKVWKVTAIYGQKFACWPMNCPGSWPTNSVYATRSAFKVNGGEIVVFNQMYNATAGIYYQSFSCSGSQSVGGPQTNCLNAGFGEYINTIPDRQTTLPLWLPAGTTLQTVDAAITLSVLEFSIVP
jgi:hypothetical protein